MKKLGELLHKTNTGLLIVRSSHRDPRRLVGAIVYDRDMRRIGRIVDVIGPTESPYIVVKPESREIADLVEPGPVYFYLEKKPTRGKRKVSRKKRHRR